MAITTIERAHERLLELCPVEDTPAIELDIVERVLDEVHVVTVWAASTPYVYGQKVLPTMANGRVYRVVTPGTSDTTEPDWPTNLFQQFSDGNDLVWEEAGRAPADYWDLEAAAFRLWMMKASKAAQEYDLSSDGQNFSRSQLIKHCREMAAQYAPVLFV